MSHDDARHRDRTNALVATVGLAVVLWAVPLSIPLTLAVVVTLAATAWTWRLTANPVRVVSAPAHRRDERPAPSARSPR